MSQISTSTQQVTRRQFVGAAAVSVAAAELSLLGLSSRLDAANEPAQQSSGDKKSVRPFHVSFSEEELIDLRRRIHATKWPEREQVSDASQGVQLATMQSLARYWGTDYDWRKVEARLNALPNFVTEI